MTERVARYTLRCPVCEAEYDPRIFRSDATPKCSVCKSVLEEQREGPESLADFPDSYPSPVATPTSRVIITGLDVPFWHLVRVMVKLALAAIPAVIILALLWWLFGLLMVGLLGGSVAI